MCVCVCVYAGKTLSGQPFQGRWVRASLATFSCAWLCSGLWEKGGEQGLPGLWPSHLSPLQASVFPSVYKALPVVLKGCSKVPCSQEEILNCPRGKDAPKFPLRLHPHTCLPFRPGPPLQDVTAKCRWGRGRCGRLYAGTHILGTRRWELQVPVA